MRHFPIRRSRREEALKSLRFEPSHVGSYRVLSLARMSLQNFFEGKPAATAHG